MKKRIIYVSILLLALLLESCGRYGFDPPREEEIESFVTEHFDEISIINNYLLELGNIDVSISNGKGSVYIGREEKKIEDTTTKDIVRWLWRNGCKKIYKDCKNNAVVYKMWKRTYDEADCGFVYAIDSGKLPEAEFQTELIPLSEEGWYYYLAEYNEWRIGKRAS